MGESSTVVPAQLADGTVHGSIGSFASVGTRRLCVGHSPTTRELKAGGAPIAEAFPQLLAFRVRTRNWWLLLLTTFLCLLYCGWCARNIAHNFLDYPIVIYFVLFLAPSVLVLVVAWWKERWLLHIGKAILGFASLSYGRWRYEFRLDSGETRGGFCKIMFWNKNFVDNLTPVLLNSKNPDFSKPGLDFAFQIRSDRQTPSANAACGIDGG
jgi:hypothetical protein